MLEAEVMEEGGLLPFSQTSVQLPFLSRTCSFRDGTAHSELGLPASIMNQGRAPWASPMVTVPQEIFLVPRRV